jgi:hypothetical protein
VPSSISAESISKLNVGHKDLNASFIKPYYSEFEFFVEADDGSLIQEGHWTDSVDFIESEGNHYIRRKVIRFSNSGEQNLKRVMVAEKKTLAPISSHQVNGDNLDMIIAFHYAEKEISATQISSANFDIKKMDVSLDQSPFDLSFWSTLALSIPFEKGYQAMLPVYKPGNDKVSWETFKVIGHKTIKISDENYKTHVIEASPSNWKFWLRKEFPYVVKIEHPLGKTTAISMLSKLQQ